MDFGGVCDKALNNSELNFKWRWGGGGQPSGKRVDSCKIDLLTSHTLARRIGKGGNP